MNVTLVRCVRLIVVVVYSEFQKVLNFLKNFVLLDSLNVNNVFICLVIFSILFYCSLFNIIIRFVRFWFECCIISLVLIFIFGLYFNIFLFLNVFLGIWEFWKILIFRVFLIFLCNIFFKFLKCLMFPICNYCSCIFIIKRFTTCFNFRYYVLCV